LAKLYSRHISKKSSEAGKANIS